MKPAIRFSAPTPGWEPSRPYVRADEALLAAAVTLMLVFLILAWALWRTFGTAVVPPGGLLGQIGHWPALLAWSLTPGAPLGAWADNPAAGTVSAWAIHARLLPALLGSLAAGVFVARRVWVPRSLTQHVSGPQVLEGPEAVQSAQTLAAQERGKGAGWLALHPLLDLPRRRWTRHLLIYGSVGSGKTQIIWPILAQLAQKARAATSRRQRPKAFVLDVKGDYTEALPDAALLSPWDARSRYWDIAMDVRTSSQADTFAASMIPSGENQGANQFFSTAAQLILAGCVRALQRTQSTAWTWADLDLLLSLSATNLAPVLAEHHVKAAPLVSGSESASASVLSTLAAFTQPISQLAEAWGDGTDAQVPPRKRLSLIAWARDDYRGRPMIVAQAGPDSQLTQRYLAAAMDCLVPAIISPALPDDTSPDGRALFFVFDELTAAGRFNLSPLIDKGRSKGCCVIVGVQDLAQVEAVYGPHQARALAGMVGTHLICQVQLGETRDTLASMLGSRRVSITVPGEGSSSTHEEMRQLIQPTDLTEHLGVRSHRDGFGVCALANLGGDLLLLEWPGQGLPRHRRSFVPADWTLPGHARLPASADTHAGTLAQQVANDAAARLDVQFHAPLPAEEPAHVPHP